LKLYNRVDHRLGSFLTRKDKKLHVTSGGEVLNSLELLSRPELDLTSKYDIEVLKTS